MACKGIKNFLKMSRPEKSLPKTVNFYAIKNLSIDASVYVCEAQTLAKVESRGKIYFHYAETKRIYEL